jgi:hypothetical protein
MRRALLSLVYILTYLANAADPAPKVVAETSTTVRRIALSDQDLHAYVTKNGDKA